MEAGRVGPEAGKPVPVILKGVSRESASDRPQLHASSECPGPGDQGPSPKRGRDQGLEKGSQD